MLFNLKETRELLKRNSSMKILLQVLWLAVNLFIRLINCRIFFPRWDLFVCSERILNYFSSEHSVFPSCLHPKNIWKGLRKHIFAFIIFKYCTNFFVNANNRFFMIFTLTSLLYFLLMNLLWFMWKDIPRELLFISTTFNPHCDGDHRKSSPITLL